MKIHDGAYWKIALVHANISAARICFCFDSSENTEFSLDLIYYGFRYWIYARFFVIIKFLCHFISLPFVLYHFLWWPSSCKHSSSHSNNSSRIINKLQAPVSFSRWTRYNSFRQLVRSKTISTTYHFILSVKFSLTKFGQMYKFANIDFANFNSCY